MGVVACIPVYNEEKTLSATVNSILEQDFPVFSINIALSGSNKATRNLAYQLSEKNRRVNVIESRKGKPKTWNDLVKSLDNSADLVYFVDGDVTFERDSFRKLHSDLERSPGKIVMSGREKFVDYPNFWSYVLLPPDLGWMCSKTGNYVVGAFYLAKIKKLKERMKERGYEEMPEQLINEDGWLSRLLGKENIGNSEAVFYHNASGLRDYYRSLVRNNLGILQLDREFADLNEIKSGRIESLFNKWEDLGLLRKLIDPLVCWPIRRTINYAARRKAMAVYGKDMMLEVLQETWRLQQKAATSPAINQ